MSFSLFLYHIYTNNVSLMFRLETTICIHHPIYLRTLYLVVLLYVCMYV